MRAKLIPQDGHGSYRFINMPRTSEEWRAFFGGYDVEPIFLKKGLILLTPDYGAEARNTAATKEFRILLDMRGTMLQDGFIMGDVVVLDTAARIKEWRTRGDRQVSANSRVFHKGDKARAAKYGLTLEQYAELIKRPCEICGDPRATCIDHDHETNKVRGHLCHRCNLSLGTYERLIREGLVSKVFEYVTRSSPGFLSETGT